jgi:hypothetical protein
MSDTGFYRATAHWYDWRAVVCGYDATWLVVGLLVGLAVGIAFRSANR